MKIFILIYLIVKEKILIIPNKSLKKQKSDIKYGRVIIFMRLDNKMKRNKNSFLP